MIRSGQGRAGGKIILIGEHSVVYGKPAISLPFPAVEVTTTVTECLEGGLRLHCAFYEGLVHDMPEALEGLRKGIYRSLYQLGIGQSKPSIRISIQSQIPAGRGMGSSAAVVVSVVRALFAFYDKPLTASELWDIAQRSERLVHGRASGIDVMTVSRDQSVYYIRGQEPEVLSLSLPAYLIVADTGQVGQTSEAVQQVADWIVVENEGSADLYFSPQEHIETLGQLVQNSKSALIQQDSHRLGDCMNQAQRCLADLGVSNKHLDSLIQTARQAGALGAKLTGGGRGGCMIALAESAASSQMIARYLKEAGASQVWVQNLAIGAV